MPRSNLHTIAYGFGGALIAACAGWVVLFLAPNGGTDSLLALGLNPREEALKTIAVYTGRWAAIGFGIGCAVRLFASEPPLPCHQFSDRLWLTKALFGLVLVVRNGWNPFAVFTGSISIAGVVAVRLVVALSHHRVG